MDNLTSHFSIFVGVLVAAASIGVGSIVLQRQEEKLRLAGDKEPVSALSLVLGIFEPKAPIMEVKG